MSIQAFTVIIKYVSEVFSLFAAFDWSTLIAHVAIITGVSIVAFFLILIASSSSSIVTLLILRWLYLPKAEIVKDPIYFDYSQSNPSAKIHLLYPNKQWVYSEMSCKNMNDHNCKKYKNSEVLYLKRGTRYDFFADFVIPKSIRNYRIAVSTLYAHVFNIHGEIVATSVRSLVIPYKSQLTLWMESIASFPFRFVGVVQPSETVHVRLSLMDDFIEVKPSSDFVLMSLVAPGHTGGGESTGLSPAKTRMGDPNKILLVEKASLSVHPKLSGLSYYLFHYPWLSFITLFAILFVTQVATYSFWSIIIGGGLYIVYLCNLTPQTGTASGGVPMARRDRGGQPRYIGIAAHRAEENSNNIAEVDRPAEETAYIHDTGSDTVHAFSAGRLVMSGSHNNLEISSYTSSVVASQQDSGELGGVRYGSSNREIFAHQATLGFRDDDRNRPFPLDGTERETSDSQSNPGSESTVLPTLSTGAGEVTLLPRLQPVDPLHSPSSIAAQGSEAEEDGDGGGGRLTLSPHEYEDYEDAHFDADDDSIGVYHNEDSDSINDSGFDGPSGIRRRPRRQPTPPAPPPPSSQLQQQEHQQQQRLEQPVFIGII